MLTGLSYDPVWAPDGNTIVATRQQSLNQIIDHLPDGAKRPVIYKFDPQALSVLGFVQLAAGANLLAAWLGLLDWLPTKTPLAPASVTVSGVVSEVDFTLTVTGGVTAGSSFGVRSTEVLTATSR